ncbi:hypothetical protein HNY73_002399 [Argiope bruennichi]|uniref:Uncharacterized protein n=1 Tax=Argiope bruennichi TaxID=94029 RepID=A0A8T0FUG5_ARGBR|nr:hypothetical protein HNY73_002399 [Argiope bruennichi]
MNGLTRFPTVPIYCLASPKGERVSDSVSNRLSSPKVEMPSRGARRYGGRHSANLSWRSRVFLLQTKFPLDVHDELAHSP